MNCLKLVILYILKHLFKNLMFSFTISQALSESLEGFDGAPLFLGELFLYKLPLPGHNSSHVTICNAFYDETVSFISICCSVRKE